MDAILYIHGKGGSHMEIEQYKMNCKGFDMIGVDYDVYLPWMVQSKIKNAYNELCSKYEGIYIIANSIGAYFAMHTLQNCDIKKALFISPILDMEKLILDMMNWASVSEKELCEKGEIETDFNETLSWNYLKFVREHPIEWHIPTSILYAKKDHLNSLKTVNEFVQRHNSQLTIMENGEHFFHTDEQISFLNNWMKAALQ